MSISAPSRPGGRQTGLSLVEVIIFVVIVSVGVAGLMMLMNTVLKHSADPMLRKQAIAIAESLLEEIELQPFTYCDPDDPKNLDQTTPPASGADCTNATLNQSVSFPTPGESRGSVTNPFDNVADYNGFSMTGITSLDAPFTVITGLENYSASVAVAQDGATFGLAGDEALRIVVTVTDPYGEAIKLTGYRFRYAPVATP
jgi:MSHA pilin protein MshD